MIMSNISRARPSQALIIMTMVMAVSLVIGVAIASRVVTTLRQISYTEQSALALSFAESGVEQALKRLENPLCAPPNYPESACGPFADDVNGDGTNDFSYSISQAGGGSVFSPGEPLGKDKAFQVNLEGYGGTEVNVYWAEETANPAAMEISVVYFDGTQYQLKRDAYDPIVTRGGQNQFLLPTTVSFPVEGVTYRYQVQVALPALPASVKFLRLRAIYNSAPFAVVAQTGTPGLPAQGARIVSTGSYGEIQRTVEVLRTLPALSELFDFVIFSGAGL